MKILAIRGKNLASLAGEFELHFQQSPLATAGLFAICGPTGSGKSTLLDALCLALYDETPRLAGAAGKGISLPDVGEDAITPQDSRNLLRRGAGEGFAEVDFIGNDGVEYRARWSVRRARGKASGKLQNTELLLQTVDGGQIIGRLKDEVQQAIRDRLGLTFPQFTRAVLLAQNEFAAFLKAKDNERAELLETLTGLDVYARISIRAYQRTQDEKSRLDALQTQLADQQPLDAAALTQLEQTLAAATAEVATLEQRKTELDRCRQWHEHWQTLQQGEQQARDAAQQARADQEAAAPRQQQLTQVEAVQNARPIVDTVDRTTDEVAKHHQTALNAEGRRDEAQRNQRQAEEARRQADQAFNAAQQQHTDASEALHSARSLDTAINTLIPGHDAAKKNLAEARQAEANAQQRLADKQTERQQVAQQLQTAQNWLTQHQPLRLLAEDWPRWDELLQDAAALQNHLHDAGQKVFTGQQDVQNKQQGLDQATGDFATAELALQTAEDRLRTARTQLASFDTEALAHQRNLAEQRRDRLAEAERLWMVLDSGLARQRELEGESHTLRESITQTETVLTPLVAEQPTVTARLEQAEKSLKTAEAACARNVETLRASLEPDVPCPVCGATAHPYAAGDAPSRALLASLKVEVDECRKALDHLRTQATAYRTSLNAHRQRLTIVASEQDALTAAVQRDRAAWDAHPLAAELKRVDPTLRLAWFIDQRPVTQGQLATLNQQENACRQAAQQRDNAQKARDQAQKQHAAVQNARNMAQTVFEQAMQTLKTAQERLTELAHQLQERLTKLDAAFSGHDWRPLWQADPVSFHEVRRQKVTQWNDQSQQVEKWQNQLGALDIEINSYTDVLKEKSTQRQRAADVFQSLDGDLQAKRQKRQTLFDGRAATEVEAQFAKAIEDARLKLQQQAEAAQKAAHAQASAEATLKREQEALTERQQAAEQATAALNEWLAAFNTRHPGKALDLSTLRALLAHDSSWLKQEQETLRTLADTVNQAETILKERQRQREAHEQRRAGPDSTEAIQEAWQKNLSALETAQDLRKEAEIRLRQDQERRDATKDLQERIAQQASICRIWDQLNDLIGSADGKKFRNHAQQFTLDVLLGYANRHLADVSRRYRLERVKDTLALMVVDQDMGDERRSVHSLSGGESFLVALALALGLASLSSNRVRVESLFIDEGFGSLDADTLRVAMDALDRLQAQGRKVGVISHVQEMTERIGVQIHVQRQSGGQSRIEVRGT
jgi:exonuclease SbcC